MTSGSERMRMRESEFLEHPAYSAFKHVKAFALALPQLKRRLLDDNVGGIVEQQVIGVAGENRRVLDPL